jgi:hypothetical protein
MTFRIKSTTSAPQLTDGQEDQQSTEVMSAGRCCRSLETVVENGHVAGAKKLASCGIFAVKLNRFVHISTVIEKNNCRPVNRRLKSPKIRIFYV